MLCKSVPEGLDGVSNSQSWQKRGARTTQHGGWPLGSPKAPSVITTIRLYAQALSLPPTPRSPSSSHGLWLPHHQVGCSRLSAVCQLAVNVAGSLFINSHSDAS
ncbi:hypothetical protein PGTUg99_008676 [Puccinia graminis f. sp. tritici]|uniref:Uncharacterized protein n=1 Tax=Puccinia graminis f. sp. tritici TaxID=56615 RepID=A0A5B0SNR2_PUCGR|nr:hypothetical protein PGTUg99_008676 [Puccinia graminis f. sp. tritici]